MEYFASLLLLLTALRCTTRTRFVQFRRFCSALAAPFRKGAACGGVSPFEAAATSLASTIGTGNIAGVAGAILLGGPGTVFWMWVTALPGMAAKYVEIYFGMRCREGALIGPMAYIRKLLPRGMGLLAPLYAAICAVSCLTMGNLVQINAASEAVAALAESVSGRSPALLPLAVGVTGAAAVGAVQYGGARRVGKAAAFLVPVMSCLYIVCSLLAILTNLPRLPGAFAAILKGAWTPKAFLMGVSRGMFSHEAGLGTAAVAHASADTDNAHGQALYGIFEVFFDTLVICTLTALAVLCTDGSQPGGDAGRLVINAFSGLLGTVGAGIVVSLSLILFAFSSILSFSLYGSLCAGYLLGKKGAAAYRLVFLPLIALGACLKVSAAWKLADVSNMALAVVNSVALLFLLRKKAPQSACGALRQR